MYWNTFHDPITLTFFNLEIYSDDVEHGSRIVARMLYIEKKKHFVQLKPVANAKSAEKDEFARAIQIEMLKIKKLFVTFGSFGNK